MKKVFRVAIRGFTSFERATFESFFRLSTRRAPAYEYSADLRDSQFVIADADDARAIGEVGAEGMLDQTVAIGAKAPDGVALRLPRPINLMAVVKALDQMPQLDDGAAAAATAPAPTALALQVQVAPARPSLPAAPTAAPAMPAAEATAVFTNASLRIHEAFDAAQPLPRVLPDPPHRPAAHALLDIGVADGAPRLRDLPAAPRVEPDATARLAEPTSPTPADGAAAVDHILVVDDSDIALRFMAGQLERYGFEVHLSRSGEEAIERTLQRSFAFVFLDVNMPGLDGFQTCKAIKRRPYPAGVEPPTIVMLTSRDTPIDKLRGTMAGCDAYLTKPLGEAALLKVIGEREVRQHEFAETARASDRV